ncbi:histidine kinase [Larkinella knui]|nr:histidine kinase [Larkinella knui]
MSDSKLKRISVHLLFWLFYVLYDTMNTSWGEHDYFDFSQIHKVWANVPLTIGVVYLNLYGLMPRYLYARKYVSYGLALVVVVVAYALVTRFIGYQFWLLWDRQHAPHQYLVEPKNFFVPIRIARNSFRLYPILALTMLIKVLRNSYGKERQLRIAESERHKVELSYLRAQLHPHFFFNTLNSLYSLTLKKSDRAPDVVMRLSGLMQYILYDTNAELVLLEGEIAQLKNYIAIEELRFADRIEYSFQSSGPVERKLISPLVLLPFVENAFKHSLSHELHKAWVTITIKVTGYHLFFNVENSIAQVNTAQPHQGIGLMNVSKRLALSYPGRHELQIKQEENTFSVNLKIQLYEEG